MPPLSARSANAGNAMATTSTGGSMTKRSSVDSGSNSMGNTKESLDHTNPMYEYEDEGAGSNSQAQTDHDAFINQIRYEQQQGPPPTLAKRKLIFDSLQKIITRTFGKGSSRAAVLGETRGTYIFSWGAGYHGQLGRNFQRGKKKYSTIPKIIHLNIAVRQIACGGLHTAAVTDSGTVYTWGDARSYQLGYAPYGFTNQPTPHLVESLDSHVFVTQVACGQTHTVALTDKGTLITWGSSKFGQCGHNDRQIVKAPKKVKVDDPSLKFIDISCGDKHTVALTSTGRMWAFGCSQQGQLGLNENPPIDKLKPTQVTLEQNGVAIPITSVVCGSIHTCAIDINGSLWLMGFGEHFMPNDNTQNFFYKPVQIPFFAPQADGSQPHRVVEVACGQAHILALTATGDVYAWGSGTYGQLGHGVKGDLNVPRLVLANKQVASIAAGRYHSVALTNFGALYSWGCGENGQLGHHNDENILFPRVIEPNLGTVVGQLSCGEHHTAVLTSTPWSKLDPQMLEWLQAETHEYKAKNDYSKRTNHGLMRRDLQIIESRMNELKQLWQEEKQQQDENAQHEWQRDIQSIQTREQILNDITTINHSQHANTQEMDRPDSRSLPIYKPSMKQKQTSKLPNVHQRPSSGESLMPTARLQASPPPPVSSDNHYAATQRAPTNDAVNSYNYHPPNSQGITSSTGAGGPSRAAFLKSSVQLVKKMKNVIQQTEDSSNVARLNSTTDLVLTYRKEYDALRHQSRIKEHHVDDLKHTVESLKHQLDNTRNREKLSDLILSSLHMKLSTVTIKITETEENRRNYALNITHLKDEELERYYQLENLRKLQQEHENVGRRINDIKLHALEEKDKVEQELDVFRGEVQHFSLFIRQQVEKFEMISRIATERRLKREKERMERETKKNEKYDTRVDRLNSEIHQKENEITVMQQQLQSVHERLSYFEKRYNQIVSVTGLTNPDEIINKFLLKEEIRKELEAEISSKQQKIQALQSTHDEVQQALRDEQEHHTVYKWKDIDQSYERVRQVQTTAANQHLEVEKNTQKLTVLKEGLLSILTMLPVEILVTEGDDVASSTHHSLDDPTEAAAVIRKLTESTTDETTLLQVLSDKLQVLAQLVAKGEVTRIEQDRQREERKRERELQLQQKVAADLAEKMKILTRRNNQIGINRPAPTATTSQHTAHSFNDPAQSTTPSAAPIDDNQNLRRYSSNTKLNIEHAINFQAAPAQ